MTKTNQQQANEPSVYFLTKRYSTDLFSKKKTKNSYFTTKIDFKDKVYMYSKQKTKIFCK